MKIQLINLGRNNINKVCEINIEKGLVNNNIEDTLAAVASRYLMSRDITCEISSKDYYTVYAGFRAVGRIKIIEILNADRIHRPHGAG